MRFSRRERRGGFSLLELILAMAMVAMLAATPGKEISALMKG